MDIFKPTDNKRDIIDLIIKESRYRKIVPFIGSGISFSTGFPTIVPIIHYLAKVDFAIRAGVYADRFPSLNNHQDQEHNEVLDYYRSHPSRYLRDFGWPNFGGLDADLWAWIEKQKDAEDTYKQLESKEGGFSELAKDFKELAKRDHLTAIVQWTLRREQAQRDEGTAKGVKLGWERWKKWRTDTETSEEKEESKNNPPKLLHGDWELLLDTLCEGDFGLVDRLFSEFESELFPAQAHRLLALLQPKLGIPLVLTTNFDRFLERAFTEEGLAPRVFDIHRSAELPDPILVERQLSVLKLHGSAYGLRFGERLRQKLEIEAREYLKQYLPKNALILVIGFSGSERRMMQLLQSFVETADQDIDKPRLIWIQGPGDPGPLYEEFTAKDKNIEKKDKKIRSCQVKHADTFLQELYFKIASSHQASTQPYLSQPKQYLTELDISLDTEKKPNTQSEINKPVHFFSVDSVDSVDIDLTKPSGSLASLAATAFVQSLRTYRVIWIDLENHNSLESLIAEFFDCIKQVDPKSPNFKFSLLNQGAELDNPNKVIQKTVERICDVFHRGKYVLVLDSLESFGRPPMVHHGVPNLSNKLSNEFEIQVKKLIIFVIELFKRACDFKDSYLVLTIDNPRQRHLYNNDKNNAFICLKEMLTQVKENAYQQNIDKKTVRLISLNNGYCLLKANPVPENSGSKFNFLPDDPIVKISPHWKVLINEYTEQQKIERATNRAIDIYFLVERLRTSKRSNIPKQGVISAFVCLLAFFRRPRSIPLRQATIERWALRNILDDQLSEKHTEEARWVIEHLLDLLTIEKSTVVERNEENKLVFKHNKKPPEIGVSLLQTMVGKDAVGVVAQRHEGGTIWLYREVHEGTYGAITEFLHIKEWNDTEASNQKSITKICALLDGMVSISWHLHIARAHYVDVFLPTQDIKAFYEYLYHRVSALRTITLLMAILNGIKDESAFEADLNKARSYINIGVGKSNIGKKESFGDPLVWYAEVIGIFSEDPSHMPKHESIGIGFIDYMKKGLPSLKLNSLKTLEKALRRNKNSFVVNSVPEAVFSWADHFVNREMKEVDGQIFGKQLYDDVLIRDIQNERANVEAESRKAQDDLQLLSKNLRYMANLSKLDLYSCMSPTNFKYGIDIFLNYEINVCGSKFDRNNSDRILNALRWLMYFKTPKKLFILNNYLERSLFKDNNSDRDREEYVRDVYALVAKNILSELCFWERLRSRFVIDNNPDRESDSPSNVLDKKFKQAENWAIAFEDKIRTTCRTSSMEATYRSDAFGIRARALYLREHFNSGHRFLDLASSGLQLDLPEHRSNAGIIHIIRAELLANSAHSHYDTKLKEVERNEFEKLKLEAYTSLKKIERAEQELNLASTLFANISHLRLWSVFLEFGQAQITLERMLFEMEILYLTQLNSKDQPAMGGGLKGEAQQKNSINTEYLKRNGALEQDILYGMEKLRKALDLLPFVVEKDYTKVEDEIEKSYGHGVKSVLLEIECMCYALWSDLYVAGAFLNSVINVFFKEHAENKSEELIAKVFGGIFMNKNLNHYNNRWKDWSSSMRFKSINSGLVLSLSVSPEGAGGAPYDDKSLRANIIHVMQKTASEENINKLWEARRKDTEKPDNSADSPDADT